MKLIAIIFLLSCKTVTNFTLVVEIPFETSFKDSSDVFVNGKKCGIIRVTKSLPDKFLGTIDFNSKIRIPQNSFLLYRESLLGNSRFEIILGNKIDSLFSGDKIDFKYESDKKNSDSLNINQSLKLKRLTSPKIIVDTINQ